MKIKIGDGTQLIDGLYTDNSRVQVGMELSRPFGRKTLLLTPFASVTMRHEDSDGVNASQVVVSSGVRYKSHAIGLGLSVNARSVVTKFGQRVSHDRSVGDIECGCEAD